jgi:hypothetical protein
MRITIINAAKNNSYARNDCFEEKQRGNSKAYLLERLPIVLAETTILGGQVANQIIKVTRVTLILATSYSVAIPRHIYWSACR